MENVKPLPYSVGQFVQDAEHAFRFLVDDYGFQHTSTKWTQHEPEETVALTTMHVTMTVPILSYRASMREVSVTHDPRGAVETIVRTSWP